MKRIESKFMKWGQQNESTIVHFVAWTLKCATKDGEIEYGKKLSKYSKDILLFLLFFGENGLKNSENYVVTDVKIWREWSHIDILAEITLNETDKYVLCLELKNYSHTSERQLKGYRTAFDSYYNGKEFIPKFVLLGVWEDAIPAVDLQCCEKYDFTALAFQDILDEVFLKEGDSFESSDNKLFDEFWTGYW